MILLARPRSFELLTFAFGGQYSNVSRDPDRSDADFRGRMDEIAVLRTKRRGEGGDAEGDTTKEIGLVGLLSHRG